MKKNILFKIEKICKTYGKNESIVKALNNVSLEINEGELLVIFGNSGSGKSTLLNILGGIDRADSGSILFNGDKHIDKMKDRELTKYRKNNIGFVFQSFNLINELTAYENVIITSSNTTEALNALKTVGLSDKKNKYPMQLSGGEQQRVSIARALAKNADILLCDEPTGALDYNTGKQILLEIEKIVREQHKTVVVVTHTREIGKMADRIITMKNGEIIEDIANKQIIPAKDIEW